MTEDIAVVVVDEEDDDDDKDDGEDLILPIPNSGGEMGGGASGRNPFNFLLLRRSGRCGS
jgi:hypothetical protein